MIIFRILSFVIAICAVLCVFCIGIDIKKNKKNNMVMDYYGISLLILVLLAIAFAFFYWAIC